MIEVKTIKKEVALKSRKQASKKERDDARKKECSCRWKIKGKKERMNGLMN